MINNISIPKYFVESILQNLFPFSLIFKSQSSSFLGEVKSRNTDLPTFKEISFALKQFDNFLGHN